VVYLIIKISQKKLIIWNAFHKILVKVNTVILFGYKV